MQQKDTLLYTLMMEGRMNLMHLPAGAISWLWDRPDEQVDAAEALGVKANEMDNPVVDACLLRADQNILIVKCRDGQNFNVYPDGGYSHNGDPTDIDGCSCAMGGDVMGGDGMGGEEEGMGFDDDFDAVMSEVPGFDNKAVVPEDMGGDVGGPGSSSTGGMGTGSPYTDMNVGAIDVIPDDGYADGGEPYSDEEMDELARAVGTMEFSNESHKLDSDRLSLEELIEVRKRAGAYDDNTSGLYAVMYTKSGSEQEIKAHIRADDEEDARAKWKEKYLPDHPDLTIISVKSTG
jgi:hypothetical protein